MRLSSLCKLLAACAKSMKLVDRFMVHILPPVHGQIHSGQPAHVFLDIETGSVLMCKGILGIKVKNMLDTPRSQGSMAFQLAAARVTVTTVVTASAPTPTAYMRLLRL
ncbi:hypothetical protein HDU96_000989, partial [Phlyctochytrium bullatum]